MMTERTMICKQCGIEKSYETNFSWNYTALGRDTTCKECRNKNAAERYRRRKAKKQNKDTRS